ncbi:hypothetical protein, partial [Clostridium sp. BL-8]|uniref:hypothetical protein n=1 Tax=Clostridium sp. BL-8 TaxID=349938 RepID=UPI001A9A4EB8
FVPFTACHELVSGTCRNGCMLTFRTFQGKFHKPCGIKMYVISASYHISLSSKLYIYKYRMSLISKTHPNILLFNSKLQF